MNFYETVMGKRFFEGQIPQLIDALEDIAKRLSEKSTPINLPIQVPDNYLEELYYGNLDIGAASYEGYSEKRIPEIIKIQEELQSQLTPEQWELYLKYNALVGTRSSEEAGRMFQHGFRLAVRLIMAGLYTPPEK